MLNKIRFVSLLCFQYSNNKLRLKFVKTNSPTLCIFVSYVQKQSRFVLFVNVFFFFFVPNTLSIVATLNNNHIRPTGGRRRLLIGCSWRVTIIVAQSGRVLYVCVITITLRIWVTSENQHDRRSKRLPFYNTRNTSVSVWGGWRGRRASLYIIMNVSHDDAFAFYPFAQRIRVYLRFSGGWRQQARLWYYYCYYYDDWKLNHADYAVGTMPSPETVASFKTCGIINYTHGRAHTKTIMIMIIRH